MEYFKFVSKTPYFGRISCSEISLNPVGKTEAKFDQLQIPISISYFLSQNKDKRFNFFIEPSFSFNIFNVQTDSNDSIEGDYFFKRNYFRLGLGFLLGCEYKISMKICVEGALGFESPNIILKENDDIFTNEVEALVKSKDEFKEKVIFYIPFKLRLLYLF